MYIINLLRCGIRDYLPCGRCVVVSTCGMRDRMLYRFLSPGSSSIRFEKDEAGLAWPGNVICLCARVVPFDTDHEGRVSDDAR